MIAKLVQGTDFRGVVNYVARKPDAELLASRGLRNNSIDAMVDSFRTQASLCPITKPVAHISLNFSVQDKARITNRLMIYIAEEYLGRMGYGNTQVLAIRHNDREHPHLHLVINRIDNDGKRISDKSERLRSIKVCRELTAKYGLYLAPDKAHVKRDRLREPDKTRYEIHDAIKSSLGHCRSWDELTATLARQGIETIFKYKGSTDKIDGVKFSKNGCTFSGSKIDIAFSFSKLDYALNANNRPEYKRNTPPQEPKLTQPQTKDDNLSISLFGELFDNGNICDPDEEAVRRAMLRRKKKKRGFRI